MTEAYNGASAEGTQAWTNPSYARGTSADLSYATCLPAKNGSIAGIWKTYGFSVPAGATITKVEVIPRYRFSVNTSIASLRIEVSWNNGTNWGTAHNNTTEYLSDTDSTVDVTADASWTPTNLGDSYFLVRVTAIRGSSNTAFTTYLDRVPVRVTYSNDQNITVTETLYSTEASMKKDRNAFPTDTVALAEGSMLKDRNAFLSDTIAGTDTTLRDLVYILTDLVSTSDEIALTKQKVIEDLITSLDIALRDRPIVVEDVGSLYDPPTLTDKGLLALEVITGYDSSLTDRAYILDDPIAISDAVSLDRLVGILEAVYLSDQAVKDKLLEILEAFQINDSLATDRELPLLDVLMLSENLARDRNLSTLDTATSQDLAGADKGIIIGEALSLADLVEIIGEVVKDITDSLGIQDTMMTDRAMTVLETLMFTEAIIRDRPDIALSDALAISEALSLSRLLVATDSIALDEQTLLGMDVLVTDGLQALDEFQLQKILTLLDTIGTEDFLLLERIIILLDGINLADSVGEALPILVRLRGSRTTDRMTGVKDPTAFRGTAVKGSMNGDRSKGTMTGRIRTGGRL